MAAGPLGHDGFRGLSILRGTVEEVRALKEADPAVEDRPLPRRRDAVAGARRAPCTSRRPASRTRSPTWRANDRRRRSGPRARTPRRRQRRRSAGSTRPRGRSTRPSTSRARTCAIPTTSTRPAACTCAPTTRPSIRRRHVITALEGGHETLLFASGMAAATAVFQALSPATTCSRGKVMYWSLRNWLTGFATSWGLDVELIDMTDVAAVQAAIRPGATKLIWVETPANPLWTITDIAATAELAHAAGALLAVDSTPATPVLSRPLSHGADLVMHSAHEVPQRPLRPHRRHGHHPRRQRALAGRAPGPCPDRRHSRLARVLAAAARDAHPVPARSHRQRVGAADRRALPRPSARRRGALPRPARRARVTSSRRGRCREASAACSRSGRPVARRPRSRWPPRRGCGSGDLTRRRREPHRAPREHRGGRHAGALRTCSGCRSASSTSTT